MRLKTAGEIILELTLLAVYAVSLGIMRIAEIFRYDSQT